MKPTLTHVSIVIKVHPDHCKSFPDPNGKGRKRIVAQVSVDEIERANIDFGPNPRNQNLHTKVSEAIADGLTEHPGWFLYFNRGIVLNAEDVVYNNQRHELTIKFIKNETNLAESPFGNLDGGHTNKVIINKIRNGWSNPSSPSEKQYVTLEVLVGIEKDQLPELVGARNTNVQVKELSLLVLGEDINWLKTIFEKKGLTNKISWRQFDDDPEKIKGEDVIAILSLLNPKLESKTRCYNSPGRIISELKANEDFRAGLESQKHIAFEFLAFVDYIHANFKNWYKEVELKGKSRLPDDDNDIEAKGSKKAKSGFGNLQGISIGEHNLIFLNQKINYRVVKSWLLPLAYGFTRVVLHCPQEPKTWRQVADKVGPQLYATLRAQTNEANYNLDKVGKSPVVWDGLESRVWAEYMTQRLAKV
ncbi:MAG: AIPR family protein [Candidatus Omnitrophica bacterium]|nr:AIPR family protein [Candidatus Omnitrophota bacterium]